jgi:hypothetical protein
MIKFNPDNFVDSIEAKKVKNFIKIAKNFPGDTGFIPCWGNPEGKKAPCQGTHGWEKGEISRHDLEDYPNMEMLGLLLGKKFVAIDADGVSAIAKLSEIGLNLPETLQISSTLNERHCWIFALPEELETKLEYFKFDTGNAEQLEFRTGLQYQIIAGIHPKTKKPYLSNNQSILAIPKDWLTFFECKGNKDEINLRLKKDVLDSPKNAIVEVLNPSLYIFVSRETKQFLRYGTCQGSRNVSSFNAACDLLGTAAKLEELGIEFENSAEKMFQDSYSKIPNKESFSYTEFIKVWESASGKERDCTKDDEILRSLAGIWEDEYESGADYEEIEDRVVTASGENSKAMKQEGLIAIFKADNPFPTQAEALFAAKTIYAELGFRTFGNGDDDPLFQDLINKLVDAPITEIEKLEFANHIRKIKADKQKKLDIESILRKYESEEANAIQYILNQAAVSDIDQSNTLVSFYTALSSLLPKQLKFKWNRKGSVRPNIFTVVVAGSTYGKDEIFKPITAPLHLLSLLSNNKYFADKTKHKQISEDWKEINKNDRVAAVTDYATSKGLFPDEMSPSQLREVFFKANGCDLEVKKSHPYAMNLATMQHISKQAGMHKEFGILINPSELADFISNFNRVNKDKNGAAGLIKIWNGDSTLEEVKTEELQQEADFYQCSLLSGIQPKRFKEYINTDDPSGIAARLLYLGIDEPLFIPTSSFEDCDELDSFDLKEFYLKFQEKINSLIPEYDEIVGDSIITKKAELVIGFEKNSQAIARLDKFRKYCHNIGMSHLQTNEAAFQWYRRLAENIVKFALTIQCFRYFQGHEKSMQYISTEAIEEAIMIGEFLERQYLSITETLSGNKTKVDDQTIHLYSKMLEVCQKAAEKKAKSSVLSSDLAGASILKRKDFLLKYGSKNSKQLNKAEIHSCWQEMDDLGLGDFDKKLGIFTPKKEINPK